MCKISVIIPVYNTGSKLRECVDSILNQSYKDLEVILVDDCSRDDTFEIMEEYAEKDERVKVIKNTINRGAGFSRNRGLDIASGSYITFVDSDDYLELDTYEAVVDAIKNNDNPDIVRFSQNSFLEVGKIKVNLDFFTNNVFNKHRGVLYPKKEHRYVALETPGVCNKVFKRELIGDTRFIEGKKWEDYPFCTFLLGKASKVVFVEKGGYIYRHSAKGGNTTMGDVKKPTNRILEIYDCCDLLEEEYKQAGLFDTYENALRGNQKIHSTQRVRDVMFSRSPSHEQKKIIINSLLNLTEVKYGPVFTDEMYLSLKKEKMFYAGRMGIIEKVYSDSSLRTESSETVLKTRIKSLF